MSDREIALSMMFMQEVDRMRLLAVLPAAKSKRIREEIMLQNRLRITYDQYKIAVSSVLEGLKGGRKIGPLKSYLRPVK